MTAPGQVSGPPVPIGEMALRWLIWHRCAQHHIPAPLVIVKRRRDLASIAITDGHLTLHLDPVVCTAPAHVADFIVCHELAHVINGDLDRPALHGRRRHLVHLLVAVGVTVDLAGALDLSASGRFDTSLVALCVTVAFLVAAAAMAVTGSVTRPRELAADRTAARWFGVRFDMGVFEWMQRCGFRSPPAPLAPFSTHPTDRKRLLHHNH
jgi:Zn-dependent protease with chaperone function